MISETDSWTSSHLYNTFQAMAGRFMYQVFFVRKIKNICHVKREVTVEKIPD